MARIDPKMEAIVDLLPENGSEMEFGLWQDNIRLAKKQGNLWLKAKHAGRIQTRLEVLPDGTAQVFVSRVTPQ